MDNMKRKKSASNRKLKASIPGILVIAPKIYKLVLRCIWISFLFSILFYVLNKIHLLSFLPAQWGFLEYWLAVSIFFIGIALLCWGEWAKSAFMDVIFKIFTRK